MIAQRIEKNQKNKNWRKLNEIYNEVESVTDPQALSKNCKTYYAMLDQEMGGIDINAGGGRGLMQIADRWVLKIIIGTHF
ncbi:hypothetical protein QN360_13165 [Glaciimonas sp. CA11.2]|uniref:hypothetical protein n=1 Tax=Glaciimonas sp. CA11.2 TaxID=3048601 RepID=UPI002B227644|nr:hypothetical protein [Glaciimonas sp. CA11.2]MEB0163853.1 hypothetical protein [Glaciimonas sp. CA11.2]